MQKQVANKPNPGISVITKSKMVRVRIPRPWINKPWYFEPDAELTNSVITGIRVLIADLDNNPTGSSDLAYDQLKGFYLNMINFQNRKLINNCPVTALSAASANQSTFKRAFTRTRLRVVMEKCYVINAQDPTFPDDGTPRFIYLQINYRPVTT